jgi:hypothetical protein
MKKALFIAVCAIVGLSVAAVIGWKVGWWSTVCAAESPDGAVKATVRCHFLPCVMDGRYHYYLSFAPKQEFRPIPTDVTVKTSASAVKSDSVTQDWKTRHCVGYLQGFDDVDERRPSSIEWEQDGTVSLLSREGTAGRYEFKKPADSIRMPGDTLSGSRPN